MKLNKIKVIVAGFRGKMGATAVQMILNAQNFELVALLGKKEEVSEAFGVPVFSRKEDLIGFDADIWLDLTAPEAAYENTRFALENGFRPVVGTTGFTDDEVADLIKFSREKELGGLIAPNFALGAVLLMQFSKQAVKYFPDVEIIELHHNHKYDAPSGTSILTAKLINDAKQAAKVTADEDLTRESLPGARGAKVDDITIHSVRLPGYVAHQEVLFGGHDETLTIRHDSLSRLSFMPGVVLACKKITSKPGLTYGLEHYL